MNALRDRTVTVSGGLLLLIALGGHALSWSGFLDVALLYALLNFVGTIAVMRFFEYRNALEERDDPESAV